MRVDGNDMRRLTNGVFAERSPVWSFDGTRIAYSSSGGEGLDIFVMNADGSNRTQLTIASTKDYEPSWSPDGKICFSALVDVGSQVYIMNPDGSNQVRVSKERYIHADVAWSPDGERFAFTSLGGDTYQVFMMNIDGEDYVNLSISEYISAYPAWSPDGKKIAFHGFTDRAPGIYVMDVDRGDVKRLIDWDCMAIAWSPDGEKIAFSPANSIGVMNADGSDLKWITNHGSHPSWSPDGKKIAFSSYKSGNDEIYVVDSGGGHEMNLTNSPFDDTDPTWSPDGTKIAFTSNRDGNEEIYVMNADGTNQINLTNNPARDRSPSWCCQSLVKPSGVFLPFRDIYLRNVLVFSFTILFLVILAAIFVYRRSISRRLKE